MSARRTQIHTKHDQITNIHTDTHMRTLKILVVPAEESYKR